MKKASFKWLALGLLLVFGFAIVAEAQEREQRQRGQRGQRGGGQGGQRGGGQGGQRGQRGGGFGGRQQSMNALKLGLLQIEKVTDSLDVLPDQTDDIKKDVEKLRSEGRGGNQPRVNFRELSEEERNKLFAQFRERAAKQDVAIGKVIEDHLLPPQDERLTEIAIQVMGVGALSDKKIAEGLKVTEAQQEKMKGVRDKAQAAMREKMSALFRRPQGGEGGARGGFDREAMMKAFTESRKETEKNVLAVLTKSQKDDFAKMKGEPFEGAAELLRSIGGRGGQRGRGGPGGAGGRGRGGQGGNRPARPARPGGGNDN